ncbi:MAG: oligosaccharide flippase family protein, partial [Elusimicrobia bacterium]|nr:oligosaccharide flippase family protein [Elusimicrobiota bacterium]
MSEVGVRKILRSSSLISAVNVFGAVAAFLANLVVARLVGPTALGAVGLVGLWLLYAGLLRPGLLSAAYRQMLHFGGSGNPERALHAQNVALTYEGALVPVASLALMSAGLLYRRPLLRIGMFLAGATFLVQSFVRYQEQLQWAGHRFGLIARANLINRIFNPILDVAGAWLIGAYGLLIAPILTALATICFYWRAAPASGFRPTRDDAKAKELLAAGLPLTMITVLYWGFRTSDRTMVAAWFPLKA